MSYYICALALLEACGLGQVVFFLQLHRKTSSRNKTEETAQGTIETGVCLDRRGREMNPLRTEGEIRLIS